MKCLRRRYLLVLVALFLLFTENGWAEEWSQKYINSLPDSAFASVEVAPGGKKVRHLPHHDHTGAVDVAHLMNALSRFSQVKWIDPENAEPAKQHLLEHLAQYRRERLAKIQVQLPLNLNKASRAELDQLPFIGAKRAQAIIAERERRGGFRSVDELLEIRGIGPFIFEAIKDLVTVGEE